MRVSLRADQLGKLDGRVAEPAADVEHAVTALRSVVGERGVAVRPSVGDHDRLEVLPGVEQGAVPGLGRLEILRRDADVGHKERA